ncbi:MAG: GTP cyclohydrolase II [Pseudomonadota bacterium]
MADTKRSRRRVDRILDEWRRSQIVRLVGRSQHYAAVPADLLSTDRWQELLSLSENQPFLLVSARRAAVLKVKAGGERAVGIAVGRDRSAATLIAIADPERDLATPMKGPFETITFGEDQALFDDALTCMKRISRLPALLLLPLNGAECVPEIDFLLSASHEDVNIYLTSATPVEEVVRAHVPLAASPNTQLAIFRGQQNGTDHLAILVGDVARAAGRGDPILTRLHSECLTGDLLGSLKCDCGDQLRGALAALSEEGVGVLMYLAQEGRGIGLTNKMRAYSLQDQGFDTVEANLRLGFDDDERDFKIAAEILKTLGVNRIKLMTNNPQKVEVLQAHGIEITERVEHKFAANPHNELYLQIKKEKSGHFL